MANLTDNANETSGEEERKLPFEDYVIPVFSFVAIVLNALTIAAVRKSVRKINSHYVLVINQCVVDIVYSIANLAFIFVYWLVPAHGHRCLLIALWILVIISCVVVLMNLLLMTADRFVAIRSPLKYSSTVTRRRVILVVVAVYVFFSCVYLALTLTMFVPTPADPDLGCLDLQKNLSYYSLVALFAVTSVIVLAVYGYIFRKTRRVMTQRPHVNHQRNMQKTWTSLWIIITFMLFFGVDVALFAISGFVTSRDAIKMARRFTRVLHSINFICDPIIYAIRMPKIHIGYKRIWNSLSPPFAKLGARLATHDKSEHTERYEIAPENTEL